MGLLASAEHEFSWGEAEAISLFNAGPQGKADHILTALGTGNQTGAVYSMVKLDPQLALPRAGIVNHSMYGCSVLLLWGSGLDFPLGLCLLQLNKTTEATAPAYLDVFLRK